MEFVLRKFEAEPELEPSVVEWWHLEFWIRIFPGPRGSKRRWMVPVVLVLLVAYEVWEMQPFVDYVDIGTRH